MQYTRLMMLHFYMYSTLSLDLPFLKYLMASTEMRSQYYRLRTSVRPTQHMCMCLGIGREWEERERKGHIGEGWRGEERGGGEVGGEEKGGEERRGEGRKRRGDERGGGREDRGGEEEERERKGKGGEERERKGRGRHLMKEIMFEWPPSNSEHIIK